MIVLGEHRKLPEFFAAAMLEFDGFSVLVRSPTWTRVIWADSRIFYAIGFNDVVYSLYGGDAKRHAGLPVGIGNGKITLGYDIHSDDGSEVVNDVFAFADQYAHCSNSIRKEEIH